MKKLILNPMEFVEIKNLTSIESANYQKIRLEFYKPLLYINKAQCTTKCIFNIGGC